jgi:hypothetical protein
MAHKQRTGSVTQWIIDESDYPLIENACKIGVSETNIGLLLGISRAAWFDIKQRDERIVDIMENSRARGEQMAANVVWDIMTDPLHKQRLTAAIFYLKTRHRWRETNEVVAVPTDDKPTGIILVDAELNNES